MNAWQFSRYNLPLAKNIGQAGGVSGDLNTVANPIDTGSRFAFIGTRPSFGKQAGNTLSNELNEQGLKWVQGEGRYGASEPTHVIYDVDRDAAMEMGRKHGQETVVYSPGGGQHELIYVNGPKAGKFHPIANPGTEFFQARPMDNFTHIPGAGYVRMHFDHSKLLDVPKKQLEGTNMGDTNKSELSKTATWGVFIQQHIKDYDKGTCPECNSSKSCKNCKQVPTFKARIRDGKDSKGNTTAEEIQTDKKSEVTVSDLKKGLADTINGAIRSFEDIKKRENDLLGDCPLCGQLGVSCACVELEKSRSELSLESSDLEWMQELSKSDSPSASSSSYIKTSMDPASKGSQKNLTDVKPKEGGNRKWGKDKKGNVVADEIQTDKKSEDFIDTDAPPAKSTDEAGKGGPRMVNKGKSPGSAPGDKKSVKGKGDEGSGGTKLESKELEKSRLAPGSMAAGVANASHQETAAAAAPASKRVGGLGAPAETSPKHAMAGKYAGRAQDLLGQISAAKGAAAAARPTNPTAPSAITGGHQAAMAPLGRVAPAAKPGIFGKLFRNELSINSSDEMWIEELQKNELGVAGGGQPEVGTSGAYKAEGHEDQFKPKHGSKTQRRKEQRAREHTAYKLGGEKARAKTKDEHQKYGEHKAAKGSQNQ